MPVNDSDQEQIDLLVRELMTKPRVPPARTAVVSQSVTQPAPESPHTSQPVEPPRVEHRAGRRWSNVRMLMPSVRHSDPEPRVAFQSALSLPRVPDFSRFIRTPGQATQVRMWVGLGVVCCASLSYWPYPKTYLWGMVLYLLSLALVLVSGVWGARLTWEARLGAAHTVSIATVLWAVVLATVETLPRT